jgi:hypothetical protein
VGRRPDVQEGDTTRQEWPDLDALVPPNLRRMPRRAWDVLRNISFGLLAIFLAAHVIPLLLRLGSW